MNTDNVWTVTVYLEINNDAKDKDSGNKIGEIWQVLTVEGFTQTTNFICSGRQQMEQGNDSSFKLSSLKKNNKHFTYRPQSEISIRMILVKMSILMILHFLQVTLYLIRIPVLRIFLWHKY